MKTDNQTLVGKELTFDEPQFARAKAHIERKVIPAVEYIIQLYNELKSLPAFSQKIWQDIQDTDGNCVADAYRKQAQEDLSGIKNDTYRGIIMKSIEEAVSPFVRAVKAANSIAANPDTGLLICPMCQLSDVKINDKGEPVLNMARIKEICTLRIENETQASFYTAGKKAEKALKELAEIIRSNTDIDLARVQWIAGGGQWGIFFEPSPGKDLVFDIQTVGNVINQPAKAIA